MKPTCQLLLRILLTVAICGYICRGAFAQSVASLTFNPSTIASGSSSTATVTLSAIASPGGLNVAISNPVPSYVNMPSSVVVPAGSTSASFAVATEVHSRTLNYNISASANGSSISATLTAVGDAVQSVILAPTTIVGGQQNSTGTVTLVYPAPATGWTVKLSSSLPAYTKMPSTITLEPYAASMEFPIQTVAHSRTLSMIITVQDNNSSKNASLTSLGDAITAISISPETVVGGTVTMGTVTLLNPAPTGGWTVNLVSSSPAYASVPTTITVPEGGTAGSFSVSSVYHTRDLSFTITASDKVSKQTTPFETLKSILADSTWPMGRANPQNTSFGGGSGAAGVFKWSNSLSDFQMTSPTIGSDGTIYTVDGNYLYALDGNTGVLKWRSASFQSITSDPTIGWDGTIYLPLNVGLVALNENNGSIKWEYQDSYQGYVSGSPVLGPDGAVYINLTDVIQENEYTSFAEAYLIALSPSGGFLWSVGTETGNSPAISPDGKTVYIAGNDGNGDVGAAICAVSTQTGKVIWNHFEQYRYFTTAPVISPNGTIFVGFDNTLLGLNPNDGSTQWSYSTVGDLSCSPAVTPWGTFILLEGGGKVDGFSKTGSLVWSKSINCDNSLSIGSDGTAYVGSFTDGLYALDGANGAIKWHYPTGAGIGAPAIGPDGTLYFVSGNNKLYAIQ